MYLQPNPFFLDRKRLRASSASARRGSGRFLSSRSFAVRYVASLYALGASKPIEMTTATSVAGLHARGSHAVAPHTHDSAP